MSTTDWRLPRNYDITKEPDIACSECGNTTYETVVTLKRIPARVSPTGQDATVPMPVFKCCNCGALTNEYMKNSS